MEAINSRGFLIVHVREIILKILQIKRRIISIPLSLKKP